MKEQPFFSPSENRCLPASTLKPEEREFVVDSGASMHMISKKGIEWRWNGYFDEIVQSYESHNRQWRSADAWRGNGVCQRIGYSWLWKSSITRQQCYRSESFAMKTDIPTNGSMVKKPHRIRNGIRIICNTENFVPIVVPGLSSSSSGSSSTWRTPSRQESPSSSSSSSSPSSPTVGEIPVREREDATNSDISPVPVSELVDDRSGKPEEIQANKIPKTNKKETTIERGDPLCSDDSEIPEWLQEFRKILVDDEIPLQGGSHASSSHEVSLEPITKRREDLGKHNVHTHFTKDRNCEICKRTKITRAPCRRRNGEAVPRAVNFGDLITADHKGPKRQMRVSKQSSIRSRGTGFSYSMDPGVSVQKQNFTRNPREACKSSWNPRGILKSFTLTIPWNSAKLVKISPGIIARRHHIDRRLMGLLKELPWIKSYPCKNTKLLRSFSNKWDCWGRMKFHWSFFRAHNSRDVRIWVSTVFILNFPKDRNCEICKRTKITRAPCRRRNGEAVPRAANFGDLITAGQKVLSEGCESRNNHRHAGRGAGSSHSMDPGISVKNKTSQETQRSLQKFLEPERKPKVIYTDNSWEFDKVCEDHSWFRCKSTPHGSETNEWDCWKSSAQSKGRHLCCICGNQVWMKVGGQILWNGYTSLRYGTDLLSDGKTPYERRFGQPFKGPIVLFGSLVEYHLVTAKGSVENPWIWKESLYLDCFFGYALYGEENLEGWRTGCRSWRVWKRWTHRKSNQKDSIQRK